MGPSRWLVASTRVVCVTAQEWQLRLGCLAPDLRFRVGRGGGAPLAKLRRLIPLFADSIVRAWVRCQRSQRDRRPWGPMHVRAAPVRWRPNSNGKFDSRKTVVQSAPVQSGLWEQESPLLFWILNKTGLCEIDVACAPCSALSGHRGQSGLTSSVDRFDFPQVPLRYGAPSSAVARHVGLAALELSGGHLREAPSAGPCAGPRGMGAPIRSELISSVPLNRLDHKTASNTRSSIFRAPGIRQGWY